MSEVFAARVRPLEAEGAYAVLARAKALEAKGRDIIHLEIGQPDFATPEHVATAGIAAIRNGRTRYTAPAGAADLRRAIAEVAGGQRGMNFSPNEVIVGPGAKPAMFAAMLALVEPGDEVILPDPGFPSYTATVLLAGATPLPVPLTGSDDTGLRSFDMAVLKARLSRRTKLVIVNSPSNPTGGVMPLTELQVLAESVRQTDAWVLSDEIYSQLVFDGEAPSVAALPGMRERTVIIDGFSKTYAMTGWRLGFGIMPPALAERVELFLTHAVGSTADFTQVAGVAALCGDQSTVAAMRESFRARRDQTVALLNSIPGIRCALPQGAFYVFPDVRSFGRSSKWLADYLLDRAGVALLAGSDFGPGGEGYVRISYATSMALIEEAVRRMGEALAELPQITS